MLAVLGFDSFGPLILNKDSTIMVKYQMLHISSGLKYL